MSRAKGGLRTDGITRRQVVVLAGNRREFEEFCRNNRHVVTRTVYADSLDAVRGLDHIQVYKTGGWYLMERSKLNELIEWLKTRDQVGINEEEAY